MKNKTKNLINDIKYSVEYLKTEYKTVILNTR